MHELAVAQSLIDVVAAKAAECHATRVAEVRLRIGAASGVVADSLAFAFEVLASADPVLAGARLVIEEVAHRAWCGACATEFAVVDFVARCPTCGQWSAQVVSGTELRILDMRIATATAPEGALSRAAATAAAAEAATAADTDAARARQAE